MHGSSKDKSKERRNSNKFKGSAPSGYQQGGIPAKNSARSVLAKGAYLISGRRILEPTHQPTTGLSPSSSSTSSSRLDSPLALYTKKNGRLRSSEKDDSRPSTPVTVIGFPFGYPQGLHIAGNKAAKRVKLSTISPYTKILGSDADSEDEIESLRLGSLLGDRNSLRAPSVEKSTTSIGENSPRTKIRLARAMKNISKGPSQPEKLKRSSKGPVAPWRDIGTFQSPGEHRRQTFNSFKLMSADPPKTPTNESLSRHSVRSPYGARQKDQSPMNYFPPPGPQQQSTSRITNQVGNNKWSSREDAYLNSAVLASSFSTNGPRRKLDNIQGKSVTGLGLAGARAFVDQAVGLKRAPSYTGSPNTGARNKKFTVISPASPSSINRRKSLVVMNAVNNVLDTKNTFSSSSPRSQRKHFPQQYQPATESHWKSILQTNPIPLPPSKRLEQVRQLNHMLHGGYYNVHEAVQPRLDAKERYTSPTSPMFHRQKQASAPPIPYNSKNGASNNSPAAKQQQQRNQQQQQQQSLAINSNNGGGSGSNNANAGRRRENIYIGHYDGSDSDSDNDTTSAHK